MKKGQKCPQTPINKGIYGRQRKKKKKGIQILVCPL